MSDRLDVLYSKIDDLEVKKEELKAELSEVENILMILYEEVTAIHRFEGGE